MFYSETQTVSIPVLKKYQPFVNMFFPAHKWDEDKTKYI